MSHARPLLKSNFTFQDFAAHFSSFVNPFLHLFLTLSSPYSKLNDIGHSMAGFDGAIKNISIGIASAQGKSWIHSGGTRTSGWGGSQDAFLESMAEAGKSVVDALDGNILYINVMNRLSADCDCDGNPAERRFSWWRNTVRPRIHRAAAPQA
ncbi:MAG: DUF362 domain-containing protein [Oscillospiraceae bacterium]|jgi:hypothetical protein|nr:DUF362 domain-containing protein [Oscillospiraceae bacterium]